MNTPKAPIFVRELSAAERQALEAGLRSSDAFRLRRCQMVRPSARGETARTIARHLSCDDQTVRNAIHDFNAHGLDALTPGSSRPLSVEPTFDAASAERLKALIHQSPRTFGKDTSVWTLDLVADVAFAQGLSPKRVSDEPIRQTLKRLGIGWKRAKRWITSPDPQYAAKKSGATD
jgi:transposase